jgi:PAS domain S-box-containing protein
MASENEHDLVLRFVEDLTDYAIIVLSPKGTVLTWNAGARALFGRTAESMVGHSFHELYSKSELMNDAYVSSLKDALQWGRHETIGRLLREDGSDFQARIVLRPLSDASQSFAGFGMLVSDSEGVVKRAPTVRTEPHPGKVVSLKIGAKVLVVDDNVGILTETVEQLTGLGYSVVSASNGVDALAELERNADVELLFTDVVMPGEIAGRALAERAMQLRPGIKVLFASGYFEGALVNKGDLDSDVQFLAKPYRMRELAQKINEVLHG